MVQGFSEQHKNPLFYSDLANNANGERKRPKRFWMWGWPVCHRIGWNPIITEVINITCNCTVTVHHNTNLRQHEWGSKLPHPNRHCKNMHCNSSMATPWKWQQEPWRCRLWHSEKGGLLLEAKNSFNFHIKEGTERHEPKKDTSVSGQEESIPADSRRRTIPNGDETTLWVHNVTHGVRHYWRQ